MEGAEDVNLFGWPPWHGNESRAPIDQLFSRESSASINLAGDRSVDPACDHLLAYRACHPCNQMLSSGMNQHPTTNSAGSLACGNLTLVAAVLTR